MKLFLKVRTFLALAAVSALLVATVGAGPGDRGKDDGQETHAAERILVKFKAGTAAPEKDRAHRRHGGTVLDVLSQLDVQVVRVPRAQEQAKARAYRAEAAVEFAELDYGVDVTAP